MPLLRAASIVLASSLGGDHDTIPVVLRSLVPLSRGGTPFSGQLTGGTKVSLTNFNVDPGISRVYGDVKVNGKKVVDSAYLFTLDGRTLKPLRTQGKLAILTGTKVEISPVAAPLLDSIVAQICQESIGDDVVLGFSCFPEAVQLICIYIYMSTHLGQSLLFDNP